ncbi:MAG: alkaline phosphatase [Prevotellaceae bacterium]|jgi:alkaline phosphatase|nr:alkaline phosphatase [Prevotellaceae bacterium]
MKKTLLIFIFALTATLAFAQAKYFFFFIGDGMGTGAITVTEDYLAAVENKLGANSLSFSEFPVTGMATTYSASNLVTCSAAAGTALACGSKTKNGRIGMNVDTTQSFTSIAYRFKKQGYKVGITTSVSIDHATPAVFYAHQPDRNMYYEISMELGKSGFDFFAGSGFRKPQVDGKENLFDNLKANGYVVSRSIDSCKKSTAAKNVLIQAEGKNTFSFPYAIDKQKDDYTLAQIAQTAIQKLDNKKGFFLMVEGGMIDWASHNNDAAAMVGETVEFSDAIKVALDFYKKYPKQTLIVVTADHETGGLGLGSSEYSSANVINLSYQKISATALQKELEQPISYDKLYGSLIHDFGLKLDFKDEIALRELFVEHVKKTPKSDDELCNIEKAETLAKAIARLASKKGGATYSTYQHTGNMVPVYAIGAGSQLFNGKMDNTDIPKRLAKAAGIAWE